MEKHIYSTIFLLLAFFSLAAQPAGWRWGVQTQALYQGMTTPYAIYLDGPTSSTEVTSKAGVFYGIQGGIERTSEKGWIVGAMIGYQQQGLTERQETSSVDNTSEMHRERWVSHQLVLPAYLMHHLDKNRVVYARLGVVPAFSLGKSDRLIISPNAPTAVLNANLEFGAEITIGEAALRPGVLVGGSLTPATRAGDHAIYTGLQLQWLFVN